MQNNYPTMAEQVAQAAREFQTSRTGHAPTSVTAVLNHDTLVLTLHEVLTPAERTLAGSPHGAAKVQEFHRQLFAASAASFHDDIRRITGIAVREMAAETQISTANVVQVFTSGTMVQVFQLAQPIPPETWNQRRSPDNP
jgi:uncharacterized protein YbcI